MYLLENELTIICKDFCPVCDEVIKLLNEKEIPYKKIMFDESMLEEIQELTSEQNFPFLLKVKEGNVKIHSGSITFKELKKIFLNKK